MTQSYVQGDRPPILRNEYKSEEWNPGLTKRRLVFDLQQFARVNVGTVGTNYPDGWTDGAIWFFLSLHPWYYYGSLPDLTHFRCILTIIKEGLLD